MHPLQQQLNSAVAILRNVLEDWNETAVNHYPASLPSFDELVADLATIEFAEPAPAYSYHINLDERGSFSADVRDASGKTVYEIKAGNELPEGESSIFDDGFMKDKNDIDGLRGYLQHLSIIPVDATIVKG